jgi:hypothetical protein
MGIKNLFAGIYFQRTVSKYVDKKGIKKILDGEMEKPKEEEC